MKIFKFLTKLKCILYVIGNTDKVPYMTIRELADELSLSTSTILRFCNKLGCEGYSDFKVQLKEEIIETSRIEPESDLQQLFQYFQGTNTRAFEEKIRQGADILRKAETLLFVGLGSSGTLARYGARYFSNLGKFSIGLEDPYYPITNAICKETVIIVLSVSGETKEIVKLINKFQTNHVRILSITNEANSTIAKLSDWNISYGFDQIRVNGGYNATSQVPVLFLMEVLARRK